MVKTQIFGATIGPGRDNCGCVFLEFLLWLCLNKEEFWEMGGGGGGGRLPYTDVFLSGRLMFRKNL